MPFSTILAHECGTRIRGSTQASSHVFVREDIQVCIITLNQMKQRIISFLTLLCLAQGGLASDEVVDYSKVLSLGIDYNSAGGGSFVVILKNSSTEKLELILNVKEIEGRFSIEGGEDKNSFYDKDYLRKLLTSRWFSGHRELEGDGEIKWTARLEELVYPQDTPVTPQSIAGKSVTLSLDRLAVIPGVGKGNIPVKIQSNTLEIPKIESGRRE